MILIDAVSCIYMSVCLYEYAYRDGDGDKKKGKAGQGVATIHA